VEYGVSLDNLNLSATGTILAATSTFAHNVALAGLTSKTKYFYKVISIDSGNNRSQGEIKSFTTTDCNAEVPTGHAKIQQAIDAVMSGDKICVLAGAYQENIEIDGKNIILKGAGWENTSISSSANSSIVTLKNISSATIIEGLTISGASSGNYGIFIEDASPVIKNSHIKNNYAGIKIAGNSMPDINHNIFSGNNTGGAIIHNGTVGGYSIDHNTFSNNGITAGVAGVLLDSNFPNSPVTIKNNIFTGGTIGVYEANTAFNFILDNNLFYNQSEAYLKRISTIYNNVSAINDLSNAAKNIVGDPALESDYRPKANSPVLDVADDGKNIGAY
jgi:parallel beta-helix repeat protein